MNLKKNTIEFNKDYYNNNCVGFLNEFCQQFKIKQPRYNYEIGRDYHQCTCVVNFGINTIIDTGFGSNKREAKQRVSKRIVKTLSIIRSDMKEIAPFLMSVVVD